MNAITEAKSIDEVVEIINDSAAGKSAEYFGGSDTRSAEQMAGQWAFDAAEEAGYTEDQDIDAQLDFLSGAGANFDHAAALREAVALRENDES